MCQFINKYYQYYDTPVQNMKCFLVSVSMLTGNNGDYDAG